MRTMRWVHGPGMRTFIHLRGVSFRGDGAEGVEQVENPRAARRSRPRWSRMPSPAVILEPDTGEPEDHAHDDDRDCDINQGDAEPRKAVIALAESLLRK